MNLKTAQLLATSLILPRLDCSNSDFHIAPFSLNKTLQKLQNDAIRFIFIISKYSRQRISPLRKELHWLPITSRITYKICLTVHLALHHMIPDYICDIIQPNTTKYTQRPLNKFKLQIKILINLSSLQLKAFSIHAPLTWNKLPSYIRSISSTFLFKTKLKTFLFSLD